MHIPAIKYNSLPSTLRGGIQRYVDDRIRPGGFLDALLANDLKGTVMRADEQTRSELQDILFWCMENLPGPCWGGRKEVEKWLAPGSKDEK